MLPEALTDEEPVAVIVGVEEGEMAALLLPLEHPDADLDKMLEIVMVAVPDTEIDTELVGVSVSRVVMVVEVLPVVRLDSVGKVEGEPVLLTEAMAEFEYIDETVPV